MEESIDRQVEKALADFSGWDSIAGLKEFVMERIEVPDEFRRTAVDARLATVIRRQIKKRVGADGLAEFESAERHLADGTTERIYKQLSMFDKDDYRLSIDYYADKTYYTARKANSLTQRCNSELKTRRQLPFPEFGFLADDEKVA